MLDNKLKLKVRTKNLIAFWITNPNIINIEIAINKNFFDVFVIDFEHSLISISEIRNIISILNAKKIPVLIRFAKFNYQDAPKFLDYGINGVIVSDVSSIDQLEEIIKKIFYSKIGDRGVGLGRMNNHGDKFYSYLKSFNKNFVFMPMIEKQISFEVIDSIYKNVFVDGCMIGPYDLSMSLNKPGDFFSKEFQNIEKFIVRMSKKYKKAAGLHIMSQDLNRIFLTRRKGFNFTPFMTDVQFFKNGLENLINKETK
jgi:2-dehydro-3-deoxyglucarate aldolase